MRNILLEPLVWCWVFNHNCEFHIFLPVEQGLIFFPAYPILQQNILRYLSADSSNVLVFSGFDGGPARVADVRRSSSFSLQHKHSCPDRPDRHHTRPRPPHVGLLLPGHKRCSLDLGQSVDYFHSNFPLYLPSMTTSAR